MLRAVVALIGFAVAVFFIATPLWVLGLVHQSRRMVALGAWMWARVVLWCCGVQWRVAGWRGMDDGVARFYVGNHQSSLDIPLLFVVLRGNVRFLAKASLFRIPLFGWAMKRSEFVPIDRDNARRTKATIEAMLDRFRARPISLVVFPEGTRSPDGRLLPFRKGAMKICGRAALPVVPFTIQGSGAVARPRGFRITPGVVTVRFAEPIPWAEVETMSSDQLHHRVCEEVQRGLDERDSLPPSTAMSFDAPGQKMP